MFLIFRIMSVSPEKKVERPWDILSGRTFKNEFLVKGNL